MKSSFLSFGGCMTTVSVDEEAHTAVAPSTVVTSSNRNTITAEVESPVGQRRRASSFEAWLHKTLRKDDPQAEAARSVRRAKRKAFLHKLFGHSISDEIHETPTRHSIAVDLSRKTPRDETASYRLNDIYYSSIASILDQYKDDENETCEKEANPATEDDKNDEADEEDDGDNDDDLESTTDLSEVSVFDLQEDQEFYDDDDDDDDEGNATTESEDDDDNSVLGVIPETDVVMVKSVTRPSPPAYVAPPVHIPMEYTIQDRRGGTLVAGHTVLFTSASFKRKQRQLRYTMRSIREDKQFLDHASAGDSDDDMLELSSAGIESDWV